METNEKWELLSRLLYFSEQGVPIYLEGKQATPEQVVESCCVCENAYYMPDYVRNDEGVIKELRFDKITEK